MQVDKLVQLLESPVFVLLRLQLLDASQTFQPALLKSLYGGWVGQSVVWCGVVWCGLAYLHEHWLYLLVPYPIHPNPTNPKQASS